MRAEARQEYHKILAGVIDHVLRCPSGPIRVPELAHFAGFSRFHLVRLFQSVTTETLEQFLRRIRLERAAYCLLNNGQTIQALAIDCGYTSPEAFARAFHRAYGVSPSGFRRKGAGDWKLVSPSDLHWNAHWALDDPEKVPGFVCSSTWYKPAEVALVWRVVGNYKYLSRGWERFGDQYRSAIPFAGRFITVYLDNMWTHPTVETMRADIGWIADPRATPPQGMRRMPLDGGLYARSHRFVARNERNDAWSYMTGRYGAHAKFGYDEYESWPLPFEQVKTRLIMPVG
jgi:AraC family transcriptional regulator